MEIPNEFRVDVINHGDGIRVDIVYSKTVIDEQASDVVGDPVTTTEEYRHLASEGGNVVSFTVDVKTLSVTFQKAPDVELI